MSERIVRRLLREGMGEGSLACMSDYLHKQLERDAAIRARVDEYNRTRPAWMDNKEDAR